MIDRLADAIATILGVLLAAAGTLAAAIAGTFLLLLLWIGIATLISHARSHLRRNR